ncbi:MAG: Ig-like domain-containing protein, partial [Caldisericum sp.]|uniref:Ig-like domain-containing protein n=1 Tax=Caldisericum sp. TaxID=2499687 RepID=UPI003D11611E
ISGDLTKISRISVDYSTDNGSTWTPGFVIYSGFSNSMSYNWIVPNAPSSQCKLKVALRRQDGTWSVDYSDNVFIIQSPPTVTLTYPNGGETLTAGSTINVTWTVSGDLTNISRISVDYSTDNGSTWIPGFSVSSGFSNSMSKSWTVPNTPSTNCKLKIALKRTDSTWSVDYSDSTFTIQVVP